MNHFDDPGQRIGRGNELENFIRSLLGSGWDLLAFSFIDPKEPSALHFAMIPSFKAGTAGELARAQKGRIPLICYYVTFDIAHAPNVPLEICRATLESHPNVGVIAAFVVQRAFVPQNLNPEPVARNGMDKVLSKLKAAYLSGQIRDAEQGA